MSSITLATVFLFFIPFTHSEQRLRFELIKHQPCTSKPTRYEALRFASMSQAPLQNDRSRGAGCYKLQGTMSVRRPISGTVQAYVKVKSSSKGQNEKCVGADRSGCGGIGSCVYCDPCTIWKGVQKATLSDLRIEENGKGIGCGSSIKAGNHNNVVISFCMPTKSQFFRASGTDEEMWNSTPNSKHLLFMTIYVFNQDVSHLSESERDRIATDTGDKVIACHKVVGRVSEYK